MNIEKLSTHISASLWINKSKIVDVLETYKEVEEEPNEVPKPSENISQMYIRIENAYVILDDVLKRLKLVENALSTPIVEMPKPSKQNLDVEDWKDKVCLSYNDVVQVGEKSESKMLDKQYYDNLQSVSNYVQQRL
jgi:D-hexose-6-phosphate mutarotase